MTSITARYPAPILALLSIPAARRPPASWRESALCRQEDPELFFPIGTTGKAVRESQRAKAICARCPVQESCLAYAVTTHQEFGIWGGRTEDERRILHRRWRQSTRIAASSDPTQP